MGSDRLVSDHQEDPAVVGVPPETPDGIRPSATGLVAGPVEDETNFVIAEPCSTEGEAIEAAGGEAIGQDASGAPLLEGPNSS